MDRLCKFSTSILAGNVATLLLVAMATDYWQHRDFDLAELRRRLTREREAFASAARERRPYWDRVEAAGAAGASANRTDLTRPSDTRSYATLGYRHDAFRGYRGGQRRGEELRLAVRLESPALLVRAWEADGNGTLGAPSYDLAYLFSEHGSLIRDCKQLESLSIERIPLPPSNKVRCEWFLLGRDSGHFTRQQLPAVRYLELLAAAFALATIVCTLASLVSGVRGNLRRDSAALTRAAALAVATATCCTLTIALFHAKLNLRARRPMFADVEPPTLELLAWLRPAEQVTYGWSFYLAWLCVLLSMAEAGMWLHQMDRRERDAEWERNQELVERIREYYRSRNYVRGVFED